MAHGCAAPEGSVAVDGCRAGDDLLCTVGVHVRCRGPVVATAIGDGGHAVVDPVLGQYASAKGVSSHGHTRVVPPFLDDAGQPSGDPAFFHERRPADEAVHSVAGGVAPTGPVAPAEYRILDSRQFLAGVSCKHGHVLGPGKNGAR